MAKRYIILLITLFSLVLLIIGWKASNHLSNEGFALEVLGGLKLLTGKNVRTGKVKMVDHPVVEHKIWDALLHTYVDPFGKVNYAGLIAAEDSLDTYLDLLSKRPFDPRSTSNESMAFWINTYNAFTVKLILNNWPVNSIRELGGKTPMVDSPWDIKFFQIGEVPFDLNTIEHDILRRNFGDARIHFAINCASRSCPILHNRAYMAGSVDAQLDVQTRRFVNDTTKNDLRGEVLMISPIFKWYSGDFGNKKELMTFLSSYSDQSFSGSAKLSYLEYDWALNK